MLGLKIFVRIQTFRQRPFAPSRNFWHPSTCLSPQFKLLKTICALTTFGCYLLINPLLWTKSEEEGVAWAKEKDLSKTKVKLFIKSKLSLEGWGPTPRQGAQQLHWGHFWVGEPPSMGCWGQRELSSPSESLEGRGDLESLQRERSRPPAAAADSKILRGGGGSQLLEPRRNINSFLKDSL